jgi:hypothetical protein
VDAAGNIYISSDFLSTTPYSNRIFLVDRTGVLHLFAGTGDASFSGDGGPATNATVSANAIVWAPDGSGDVFITDPRRNRVRVVTPGL